MWEAGHWHATLSQPVALLGGGGAGTWFPPVAAPPLGKPASPVQTYDLGTLPGYTDSYATRINANGHVVGFSVASGMRPAAFFYTPDLGMVSLESTIVGPDIVGPDFQVQAIVGFNDRDELVVVGNIGPKGATGTYSLTPQ